MTTNRLRDVRPAGSHHDAPDHRSPTVTRPVRVLSIPAGHRYCLAVHSGRTRALPDPTEPWWPHPALEIGPLRSYASAADVVHLHFGFEHRSPAQLARWADEVHRLGLAFVLTVHDLANPNIADVDVHVEQLDVLVPRADALVTLTESAASEIARRWGRPSEVIAHPPVVMRPPVNVTTETDLIGVHFKRRRPGTMPVADAAPLLVEAVRNTGARLLMTIDRNAPPDEVAALLAWSGSRDVEVVVDGHRSDDDFAAALARLAVAVLPYRHGTHSGWLEACRDVGTRVVAPDCGHYASQWSDVETFRCADSTWDGASLTAALARVLSRPLPVAPDPDEQRRRLRHIAQQHDALLSATMRRGSE